MKKKLNKKGIVLVWLYMMLAVVIAMSGSLYGLTFRKSQLMRIDENIDKAFYLAEAGVDAKLVQLRAAASNRCDIPTTNFGDGNYSVTYCYPSGVSCADPTISKVCTNALLSQITSTGTVNGVTRSVSVVVNTIPSTLLGALSSLAPSGGPNPISVDGRLILDGRNHDANGNVIPGNLYGLDTYGLSSASTITTSGGAQIGGNDIAPLSPPPPNTYQEYAAASTFTTPEAILGLPAGSLDTYKVASPTPPFSGITYVDGELKNVNFGDSLTPSTGVLIVHNNTGNAQLKNIEGNFEGLIIADDVVNMKGGTQVLGGLLTQNSINSNAPANNPAQIKYSAPTLSDLPTNNYQISSWEDSSVNN